MQRGGARPNSGAKPKYGASMTKTIRVTDTEVEFLKYTRENSINLTELLKKLSKQEI